jgi:hypothetical protein
MFSAAIEVARGEGDDFEARGTLGCEASRLMDQVKPIIEQVSGDERASAPLLGGQGQRPSWALVDSVTPQVDLCQAMRVPRSDRALVSVPGQGPAGEGVPGRRGARAPHGHQ